MKPKKLSDRALRKIYATLQAFHREHLYSRGVKLPALKDARGGHTKDALVLAYLAKDWPNTRPVHKSELTQFVRLYYPDVMTCGRRGIWERKKDGGWLPADATTLSATSAAANTSCIRWKNHTPNLPPSGATRTTILNASRPHTIIAAPLADLWKASRICIGRESTKTVLQQAHMNPAKPLTSDNTIPQCQKCNLADGQVGL